jgi:hypothetical protein
VNSFHCFRRPGPRAWRHSLFPRCRLPADGSVQLAVALAFERIPEARKIYRELGVPRSQVSRGKSMSNAPQAEGRSPGIIQRRPIHSTGKTK